MPPAASPSEFRRLTDPAAAGELFAAIAGEPLEVAVFAYLGPDQRLLGLRHMRSPFAGSLDLSIRDVARDVLAFGATALVMAHNHPSGDPTPSKADRESTHRLARALDMLGVRLFDHLVVTRTGVTSFREIGLL